MYNLIINLFYSTQIDVRNKKRTNSINLNLF
jgi:hypothetical protein